MACHRRSVAHVRALVGAVSLVATLGAPGRAAAAPGDLDPSFGAGGRVTVSFPGGLDTASAVAVQTDGKIVVAGSSGSDFALVRHLPDGQLDAGFGTGGRVHTDVAGGLAAAMVLEPDGRIVVAGVVTADPATGQGGFGLARYDAGGVLDPTFDGDGLVVTTFAGASAGANAIARQPDGKLVVAGTLTDLATVARTFAVARYHPDGSLDTTFGGDGRVTVDVPGTDGEDALAVAIQGDGRIVVAGQGAAAFALARLNTDGSLDDGGAGDATPLDAFGPDGRVSTAFGGNADAVRGLAVQPDGKIVAVGSTTGGVGDGVDFALARYHPDGSLDTNADGDPGVAFGGDGRVVTDFGLADGANAVALQPNGRIVAAGRAGSTPAGTFFALARYLPDGGLDATFDTDGLVLTDASGGRFGLGALAVALQADGKIVAAGDSNASGNRDFGVARYGVDGALDTGFGGDGLVVTDFALNEEEVAALAVEPDGTIVAAGRFRGLIRLLEAQDPDFLLTRHGADGALDPGFGMGGRVTTDFADHGDDLAHAVARQADGRIVVAGQTGAHFTQSVGDSAFGVARYAADGTLDATFGGDGRVTLDFGPTHDVAFAVAVQADGRIVVGGGNGGDFALARFNADGSLDDGGAGDATPGDAFGAGGVVTSDFGGSDSVAALAVAADGRIVAAGRSGGDFALARYGADGTPDGTFGAGGLVVTDVAGGADRITGLVLLPDGRVVVAGAATSAATGSDVALARYNADGSLDDGGAGDATPGDAFGTAGVVTTDFGGFDAAGGIARQADGRLVVAGSVLPPAFTDPSLFAVARYDASGAPDASFGTNGRVTTDFAGASQASAVAIQADGRIVVGGYADSGSSNDFALARYGMAPAPAPALDDFLCYKGKPTKGTPRFAPVPGLRHVDAFADLLVDVKKPTQLCLPADRDGAGTHDAATHLAGFVAKPSKGQPKPAKRTVRVTNDLGTLSLDLKKLRGLLVPAGKGLAAPPPPPDPAAHDVDRFTCWAAKVTKKTPKLPKGLAVTVGDQFRSPAARFVVKKPKRLCVPADGGAGLRQPAALLVCFKVKPAKGEPRHARRTGVHVADDLGARQTDTKKEDELCVVSTLAP